LTSLRPALPFANSRRFLHSAEFAFSARRRRGFGRHAIYFLEEQAREMGVNAIHLEVDRGNEPASELYRRVGYQDHDRFLMTKWLNRE